MPLSEHEQRLLEQMERALYAEDPKLASTLRGADLGPTTVGASSLGSLGFLVGVACLLAGVAASAGARRRRRLPAHARLRLVGHQRLARPLGRRKSRCRWPRRSRRPPAAARQGRHARPA